MAIKIKILKDHALVVGSLSARVDSSQVHSGIKRIAGDDDFVWSMDQLALIEEAADLSSLTLDDLIAFKDDTIRSYFGGRTKRASAGPACRVAVVCAHQINAGIMKLYGSVWAAEGAPFVKLELFDTVSAALDWLGRRSLSEADIRDALAAP